MAYKVFANGNPLLASELNENLMQQAIAVFTDAAGRDSAITSPVNGQFAYLTGTSTLTKYNGSAWENAFVIPDPGVTEQTSNYTIVAGDANSTIFVNSGSQVTITVADVLSPGQRIDFVQKGAGAILFDPDTGVNLYSTDSDYLTAAQYAGASIICEASDEYYLIGNLTT